jgi:Tol biopolymer transport system component
VQEAVRKIGTRRAIILLAVTLAALFVASGLLPMDPSAQTTSAANGKIAYVKDGDIWVMDADGTNETNLTNTPDINERDPAWSPDGTKIAFTGPGDFNEDNSGGLEDIYVMDADPSTDDATSLTNTPNSLEYQPSWAPSGAQLAFVREVRGQIISEQSDIFVMDANGENATNLTQTDASEHAPDWSPDGEKIAFAGVRKSTATPTPCPTATATATATACPEQPTAAWKILTMDPNGQNEAILTGDEFHAFDDAPDWSPDSTKVVFMKQCQGVCSDAWEIWGVNRDGSGDTNLTPNDLSDEDRMVAQHTGPSWSPDGSEITFTRTLPSVEGGQSDIYAMPAPATLPPPSETASIPTSQHIGVMGLAASDVLLRAASAQTSSETAVRQLTTDGLSTDPDWADTPTDTQAPRVTSTSPAAGAKGVARDTNVRATFSEQMDAASITKATFKLFRCPSTTSTNCTTQITNVTLSKSTDGLRATLNPYGTSSTLLAPSTKYKAVVTTGAKDLAGNALDQNATTSGNQQKVWFFTVGN